MDNYFIENFQQTVDKDYIDQKGKFSYLRWAKAVEMIKSKDPTTQIIIKRFDNMPFLKTDLGYFVEVEVISNGLSHSSLMPVLDNRNKPIVKPNTFDINTSIQRATVKAIAFHGIGLKIYQGEANEMIETEEPKPNNKDLDHLKRQAVAEIKQAQKIEAVEKVLLKYPQFSDNKKFLNIAAERNKMIMTLENAEKDIYKAKSENDLIDVAGKYPKLAKIFRFENTLKEKYISLNITTKEPNTMLEAIQEASPVRN